MTEAEDEHGSGAGFHCREEAAETCFYDYQLYISHSTWILRSAAGPIAGDFAEFEYMSGISIT